MSKGFGRVERKLIEVLDAHQGHLDTFHLTACVYGLMDIDDNEVTLTTAQLVSVRRALRSLTKAGRVCRIGRNCSGRELWALETIGRSMMERFADRGAVMKGR